MKQIKDKIKKLVAENLDIITKVSNISGIEPAKLAAIIYIEDEAGKGIVGMQPKDKDIRRNFVMPDYKTALMEYGYCVRQIKELISSKLKSKNVPAIQLEIGAIVAYKYGIHNVIKGLEENDVTLYIEDKSYSSNIVDKASMARRYF
jgi:hypothetical protein